MPFDLDVLVGITPPTATVEKDGFSRASVSSALQKCGAKGNVLRIAVEATDTISQLKNLIAELIATSCDTG